MSFSCELKRLRNGNSYDLRIQPKMSTHGDENNGAAETEITEGSEEGHIRLSPELVDERIKASLEPLHAQISALTEMMDRLIQNSLTTESTTASTRGLKLQHESPYSEEPGSSRFLPDSSISDYRGILARHPSMVQRSSDSLKNTERKVTLSHFFSQHIYF